MAQGQSWVCCPGAPAHWPQCPAPHPAPGSCVRAPFPSSPVPVGSSAEACQKRGKSAPEASVQTQAYPHPRPSPLTEAAPGLAGRGWTGAAAAPQGPAWRRERRARPAKNLPEDPAYQPPTLKLLAEFSPQTQRALFSQILQKPCGAEALLVSEAEPHSDCFYRFLT